MERSQPVQPLRADAHPYIPLAASIGPPPMPQLSAPAPAFFPQSAPYLFPAPPPQAVFPVCGRVPLGPGGMVMHGAFPHPAWEPLPPVPHGADAMPAATPCVPPPAMHPPRPVRAPGARPPTPRLDVPPRVPRPVRPGPGAVGVPRGAKAAGEGGHGAAEEEPAPGGAKVSGAGEVEPANMPSPRSVLVTTSPPTSPAASLSASSPLPCLPPATAAPAPALLMEEPPHNAKLGAGRLPAVPPKRRMWQRWSRRAPRQRPAPVRCGFGKPRLLFDPASTRTSLMIRNIPYYFTRQRLMSIIDEHCLIENEDIPPGGVKSEYDFLYVPIDFRTLANKGYAFVNMTSPEAARRLWEHLHGHSWEVRRCVNVKTCAVDYATKQGLDKLRNHFSGSSFECDTEEFLPVWFEPPRDGTRPAVGVVNVVGGLRRRG